MNVLSKNHFLHSIKPGEFLDSPEWESCTGTTMKSKDLQMTKHQQELSSSNIRHMGNKNSNAKQTVIDNGNPMEPSSGRVFVSFCCYIIKIIIIKKV